MLFLRLFDEGLGFVSFYGKNQNSRTLFFCVVFYLGLFKRTDCCLQRKVKLISFVPCKVSNPFPLSRISSPLLTSTEYQEEGEEGDTIPKSEIAITARDHATALLCLRPQMPEQRKTRLRAWSNAVGADGLNEGSPFVTKPRHVRGLNESLAMHGT